MKLYEQLHCGQKCYKYHASANITFILAAVNNCRQFVQFILSASQIQRTKYDILLENQFRALLRESTRVWDGQICHGRFNDMVVAKRFSSVCISNVFVQRD